MHCDFSTGTRVHITFVVMTMAGALGEKVLSFSCPAGSSLRFYCLRRFLGRYDSNNTQQRRLSVEETKSVRTSEQYRYGNGTSRGTSSNDALFVLVQLK
jgi:hypothetical protein